MQCNQDKPAEPNLGQIIAKHYNPASKTMSLNAAVIGIKLETVLERIKMDALSCFYEIEHLILSNNRSRNPDSNHLPQLPPNLKSLDLSNNQLSQFNVICDLLPSTLESLYLQINHFHGEIDWRNLPHKLRNLWIFGNEIGGIIEWNELPIDLAVLYISKKMSDASIRKMPTHQWEGYGDNVKTLFTKIHAKSVITHGSKIYSEIEAVCIMLKRKSTLILAVFFIIVFVLFMAWIISGSNQ